MRKKRSVIWKIPTRDLTELVGKSNTFSDVLKYFGLNNVGGNCKTLKNRLKHDKIDYSHIAEGRNNRKNKPGKSLALPLSETMIENSTYSRKNLKIQIIKQKILSYKCALCGNEGEWLGQKMSLILDHINGIRNDHRKENLRFLCPNCNSQTPTFCGKNKKYCGIG